MKAMAYLGMGGKLAKPGIRRVRGPELAARARICHACGMEPTQTAALAGTAEDKISKGLPLSRDERLALLARYLALQETRKERGYART